MDQPIQTTYPISDFLNWEVSKQLVIQPKFQRRDFWEPKAKSYLIDTILRGMPIPPIFIRHRVDTQEQRTVRDVVDGQQRVNSVLGYIKGEFPVLKIHNKYYGGMKYGDLPEDVQRAVLGYKFMVNVLQDVSDSEVLEIFARMNTYTVALNDQELRNAKFFGVFKQTVYKIALKHYAFWKNNALFTDKKIARMKEVELVSELIASIVIGITQTKKKDLNNIYAQYDDSFPKSTAIAKQFGEVINIVGDIFEGYLPMSLFRREPLFYSLFLAIYDAKFGLPQSRKSRVKFGPKKNEYILEKLKKIEKIIEKEEPPRRYLKFVEATKRATADKGKRKIRHEFLWKYALT